MKQKQQTKLQINKISKNNKKEFLGLGGAAIAAGGFGCIFLPPLKCKGEERPTGKVVSKLLTTTNATKEFNEAKEIQSIIKDKLGEIVYGKYFIFPEKKCEVEKLEKEDLKNFNEKCKNLTRNGVYDHNINLNLSEVRILELTNGGSDLDTTISTMKTDDEFKRFSTSLLQLLTEAIVPMNRVGVLHFDIKAPNILIDDDYQMRLIDWGLSIVAKNNIIPRGATGRPIQYNIPFSALLFNNGLIVQINKILKDLSFKGDYKTNIKPKLTAMIFNMIINNPKITERGHAVYISKNIREHFDLEKGKSYFIHNLLTNYITEAIINFIDINKKEFDSVKYFYDVACKNADIWGFLTVYDDILMNNVDVLKKTPERKEQLSMLVYRYLYSPEFAGKSIDVDILVNELTSILPFSTSKQNKNKTNSNVILSSKSIRSIKSSKKTRRKRCPNGTRYNVETGECVPIKKNGVKNNKQYEIIDLTTPEGNITSVVKKSKVIIGNKTRRKRCPNGTRYNPNMGTCIPINNKSINNDNNNNNNKQQ